MEYYDLFPLVGIEVEYDSPAGEYYRDWAEKHKDILNRVDVSYYAVKKIVGLFSKISRRDVSPDQFVRRFKAYSRLTGFDYNLLLATYVRTSYFIHEMNKEENTEEFKKLFKDDGSDYVKVRYSKALRDLSKKVPWIGGKIASIGGIYTKSSDVDKGGAPLANKEFEKLFKELIKDE